MSLGTESTSDVSLPTARWWVQLRRLYGRREDRLALSLFALTVILVAFLNRSTNFFYDEWEYVQATVDGRGALSIFRLHSGHVAFVVYGLYRLLISIFGLTTYMPYRLAIAIAHAAVVVGVFRYLVSRVPVRYATAAALLIAGFGAGWQVILWGAGLTFVLPVAGGLLAFALLDRARVRGSAGAAIGAGVIAVLCLGCSAIGVPVVLGLSVEAIRKGHRRRLRVLSIGTALLPFLISYAVSTLAGDETTSGGRNVGTLVSYVGNAAAYAAAGLFQGSRGQGVVLALAFVLAFVAILARVRPIPVRPISILAIPVAMWCLTAVSRAEIGEPGAPRYLYVGGVWLLLGAFELALALGFDLRGRGFGTTFVVCVALALVPQLALLREGAHGLRGNAAEGRAALGMMEVLRPVVPAGYVPDRHLLPQIRTDAYFSAVDRFGSPAATLSEISRMPGYAQAAADNVASDLLPVEATHGSSMTGCTPVAPGTEIALDANGVRLDSSGPISYGLHEVSEATAPVAVRTLAPGPWVLSRPTSTELAVLPPVRLVVLSAGTCVS